MAGIALRQVAAALVTCLLCARPVVAQPSDEKQAAKAHFDAGNELLTRGDVAAALAEFQRSRALFPTRGNTLNAAFALQRLGRFDEALELYSSLPRDFELDREQRTRVEREVELLRGLTGTLSIRVEAGASVSIDGRERGTAPFERPLIVLGGTHTVRAQKPGSARYERRVDIVTGAEQELQIELLPPEPAAPEAPAPAPLAAPVPLAAPLPTPSQSPPKAQPESRKMLVLGVDFGPALGFGFGGPLADSCADGCSASVPLGLSPRARAAVQPWSEIALGLELGYLRLRGSYDRRADTLEPRGSGEQPGLSHDELDWSGWSLGAYAGWTGSARFHARAALGLGISFVRVRDERRGAFSITPEVGDDYAADVEITQGARSKALYLAPEVGVGFNLTPHVELGLALALHSSIVLSPARFAREGVVVTNAMSSLELAYFSEADLTGGVVFALLPRLGVSARF